MQPVVLAHGFLGFRHFLLWHQFPGVVNALHKRGIQAIQPLVHPTQAITCRARELLDIINQELGETTPVHIIAHSMGGLDARYLISPHGLNQGHRVTTLTTISTPHRGSCLADWVEPFLRPLFTHGSRILKHLVPRGESKRLFNKIAENQWGALPNLRPDYIQNSFNTEIIDHPEVRYFSYAGSVPTRWNLSNAFRYPLMKDLMRKEGPNDCMVSVESAKWGEFKGVLDGDHGEIIGIEILPWLKPKFDIVDFYVSHVESMAAFESTE
jgi:triacylglycerol lipase